MSDGTWHADVMMALRNQPKAFASDLGDDQSRYLLSIMRFCFMLFEVLYSEIFITN